MTTMLLRPEMVSFLDIVARPEGMDLRFEHASIHAESHLVGRTLRDARIPQETGLIVIALRKQKDETHRFMFNPGADTRLETGDEMIVLGKHDQVVQLRAYAEA